VTDDDLNKSQVEDEPKKPEIPCLLKLAIIGCGFCVGISGQFVMANMTFFQLMFPHQHPEFILPTVLFIPHAVTQMFVIKFVNQIPLKCS